MAIPFDNPNPHEEYNDRGGQMTFGFLGTQQGISPFGFVSWGFLWGCGDIWTPGVSMSTGWSLTPSASLTTMWSMSGVSLVTNWSGPGNQVPWAEC